jgi:hypothetical protein
MARGVLTVPGRLVTLAEVVTLGSDAGYRPEAVDLRGAESRAILEAAVKEEEEEARREARQRRNASFRTEVTAEELRSVRAAERAFGSPL